MNEILMTPDTCIRFLIWSFYYHDILPEKEVSYGAYNKFSEEDILKLDQLKETLFRCFEEESVNNACKQFLMAKQRKEPCPYTQTELDMLFAKEK